MVNIIAAHHHCWYFTVLQNHCEARFNCVLLLKPVPLWFCLILGERAECYRDKRRWILCSSYLWTRWFVEDIRADSGWIQGSFRYVNVTVNVPYSTVFPHEKTGIRQFRFLLKKPSPVAAYVLAVLHIFSRSRWMTVCVKCWKWNGKKKAECEVTKKREEA